ncbi:unnamed protein product, partial [Porites lobata]
MEGPLHYRQFRNYANRRNVLIRHLKDRSSPLEEYHDDDFRLHFHLGKDSVIDLVKILEKDLQHQTRRGLLLTPFQRGYCKTKSTENLADTKRKFYDVVHFPGVISAINGTHIRIICPNKENAMAFANRKQFYSINVQAVCDSEAFITNIVAR